MNVEIHFYIYIISIVVIILLCASIIWFSAGGKSSSDIKQYINKIEESVKRIEGVHREITDIINRSEGSIKSIEGLCGEITDGNMSIMEKLLILENVGGESREKVAEIETILGEFEEYLQLWYVE